MIFSACTETEQVDVHYSPVDNIIFSYPQIDLEVGIKGFSTRATLSNSIDEFQVWGFRRPLAVTGEANEAGASQEWNKKSIFFSKGADVFSARKVAVSNGFTQYDQNSDNTSNNKPKTWDDNVTSLYSFIAASAPSGTFTLENAVGTMGEENNHGPRLRYTLATTGSDLSTPLVYKNQPDALIATKFNHKKNDGMVNLVFSHFMTGLRFRFWNHTSNRTLVIQNVTVKGEFFKEAIFDFTEDHIKMSVNDNTYKGTFTLIDSDQRIPANSNDLMGGNDNPVTLLLLPNPNAVLNTEEEKEERNKYALGKSKTIEINYYLENSDGTMGEKKKFELKDFMLRYLPDTNTLHTANFNFVGDEFIVMFQADNETTWGNGTETDHNDVIIN